MAHFTKPAAGSWTKNYPELGTGPVDFTDSIDPAFYEDEKAAIFRKSWLNIGRINKLPRVGSYFTKELPFLNTSIVVVRDSEKEVRAFYNICRHRGNKLVWNDYPNEEVQGVCRQFTCKYHAWRYSLEGDLTFVQQEKEFFDLDKGQYGLKGLRCEVWEGFIFVNLDDNAKPLEEYLGPFMKGVEGYPFHEMTEVYSYKAEIGANWKLFIDAFAEFYHAPVLHQKQAVKDEADKLIGTGFEALHYEVAAPHSMVSSWGGMAPPKDINMVKPIERELRSGLFGPWDRPDIEGLDVLPEGLNPARHRAWGIDEFEIFPNFSLLFWAPGWFLTYHYWPTSVNSHTFEASLYFVPAKTARERLGQELAGVTFKEYALQDANTLEATQKMLETRAIKEFPLNDQEVLLRHLHTHVQKIVAEHRAGAGSNGKAN
ncbi:aromatic ring-hydroxylating oxygenase subunit alpha [Nocardia aurantia]|uniref:3-phenylpropionate/cinnamic acid dioxygenase subunit alpha n=1 Tax=Nocardia aurantia TaxID=2585199 RepID=A0A7K0DZT6_9NOCA|nr:aromatic ring-hydroxylating dioxygenase subunit alpha [Nocardia aurantia]MQY31336.1 3-phenylpropionate/cinnamic acid dioxygenase subunit alpha [Nocardia aurantia]